ncbi:MAG: hypothetical protein EBU26_03555 [Verrucomicrobia bacterium]|jgi:hypothetical protein|nr:hypothetical protein [Verrucomicrobiota bacterium]
MEALTMIALPLFTRGFPLIVSSLLLSHFVVADANSRLDEALAQIRAVGKEGAGNQAATQAIQVLHAAPVSYLMEVLQGMKDASPIAQNWLRNAAEGLADQAMKGQADLPLLDLTAFVLDVNEDPSARALGFDFLRQVDDAAAMILLRGLINDPSNALRRQAIGQLMDQAKHALGEGRDQAARILLRQGIEHAREVEQIRWIADQLATLGAEINVARLLGMLTDWQVIGPFHNKDRSGFDTVFPPEIGLDLKASYQGKTDKVSWRSIQSDDSFGMVDLNQPYPGYLKEVTAYAYHAFESDQEQEVELRLGCKNAWKIWLNGQWLFGRDEYHRGAKMDQYILPVHLKAGINHILIKLCQNEQVEDWTVEWEFQLRLCDATGKGVQSSGLAD